MRLANLPINNRYFFFKMKQTFPYAIIMTLVGVASTFIMNLSVANSYRINHIISDYQLLFPSYIFMYVYPILFALFLFSFLHKKNASDLFSAAPITKKEYYLTNMLISAIYFAAMIIIMMLISILTINLLDTSGVPQTVAFGAFVKIFLFLFLGYMQVYTITATAATFTGTIPAQLFTAAVMLLIPTGLLLVFQFPISASVDANFSSMAEYGEEYLRLTGEPVNNLIFPLNIATSPLSMLFLNAVDSNFTSAYGMMTHFTDTPAMLYTIAIIIFYAILGVEVFSRYKMENVERPFINEKFGLVIRALMFLPIITFCIMIFHQDGSVFNTLFITLFVFITVAYIVADLILRKGIKGLSKSLITYGIVFFASLVCGTTLGVIAETHDLSENDILINKDHISKITVYMAPLNVSLYKDENVKKYYIPITISDEELIESITKDYEKDKAVDYQASNLWIEVTADGKKYFAKLRVSGFGLNKLYDYIENDPKIKKSLMVHSGMSNHIKSDVVLTYVQNYSTEGKYYMTTLNKYSTVKNIRKEFEEELLNTPIQDIYMNQKIDDSFINSHNMISATDRFGDANTEMIMADIKYHDGMYYLSATEIPYDSEYFEDVFKSFNKKTEKLAVKNDDAFYYTIGAINLSDEQIINIENLLWEIPELFNLDFREVVINALDDEIIYDNSIIFAVNDNGKTGFFILNYERDIEPFIEKYADYVCSILANKMEEIKYGAYQYGELLLFNIKPSNSEASMAEIKANLPKVKELLMTKYSKENIPLELFLGEAYYWEGKNRHGINFILDDSFTTTLDVYLHEKEACENISEIIIEKHNLGTDRDTSITEKDGEVFEILKQSVLFDRLLQHSSGDLYSEKYEEYYPVVTDSSSMPFTVSYTLYSGIDYYSYERIVSAEVKYADTNEEDAAVLHHVDLRLSSIAYDKLTAHIRK